MHFVRVHLPQSVRVCSYGDEVRASLDLHHAPDDEVRATIGALAVQARSNTTTSGANVGREELTPGALRKAANKSKKQIKRAAAVATSTAEATRQRLLLEGQLAAAHVALREAQRRIDQQELTIGGLTAEKLEASAAARRGRSALEARVDTIRLERDAALDRLERRQAAYAQNDEAGVREHTRFLDTIQREHHTFVVGLNASHQTRINDLAAIHAADTAGLRKQLDEKVEECARVRRERDEARRSYVHYKRIARAHDDDRQRRADQDLQRRNEELCRAAFPGTAPLDRS